MARAQFDKLCKYGAVADWSSKLPTVPVHELGGDTPRPGQIVFDCYVRLPCGIALVSFHHDLQASGAAMLRNDKSSGRDFTINIKTAQPLAQSYVNRALDNLAELAQVHGADWRSLKPGEVVERLVEHDLAAP